MSTPIQLDNAAGRLAECLRRHDARIVFAESCTGGLVAATLTRVPGISEWLCGSAVVYQIATKREWLGVPQSLLDDPGPVSPAVARGMACGVLKHTPHATIGIAVTGHLGPNAPPEQDGLVYIASARPGKKAADFDVQIEELRLAAASDSQSRAQSLRIERQQRAAEAVLRFAAEILERP